MLGGCAAYILPQMVHKPVAHPAQSVPARAIAHDRADAVAVSVTSVQSAEVPKKKKDVESEPTSVDGPARGGTAQVEKGPGTKIEIQFEEGLGTEDTHARDQPSPTTMASFLASARRSLMPYTMTHGDELFEIVGSDAPQERSEAEAEANRVRAILKKLTPAALEAKIADRGGLNPLWIAAQKKRHDLIHVLLEFDATFGWLDKPNDAGPSEETERARQDINELTLQLAEAENELASMDRVGCEFSLQMELSGKIKRYTESVRDEIIWHEKAARARVGAQQSEKLAQIVKLRALLANQTVATAADVEELDERLLAEGLAAQREAHAELAGQTPLYAAVEAGAVECVRVPLGKNAAPSITKGGREACLRAAKARADEIGDALREMINDAPEPESGGDAGGAAGDESHANADPATWLGDGRFEYGTEPPGSAGDDDNESNDDSSPAPPMLPSGGRQLEVIFY